MEVIFMAKSNWTDVFPEIGNFGEDQNWFVIDGPVANRLMMVAIAMRYCDDLQIKQAETNDAYVWLLIINKNAAAGCHMIARDQFTLAGRFWGSDISEWKKPPEFINGAMVL
jgi:hypothetical protein